MNSQKPTVLLIALQGSLYGDGGTMDNLNEALYGKSNCIRIHKTAEALEHIKSGYVEAIIPYDEVLVDSWTKHHGLWDCLVTYVANGGTFIFAGPSVSVAQYPSQNALFEKVFRIPWRTSSYTQTDWHRNARVDLMIPDLPPTHCTKSLCIAGVGIEDYVYVKRGELPKEGSIVFAKYARGKLGYVGDVNDESSEILLKMCGASY